MGFTVKRVLRRVLRRGSEKGVSRRCLERPLGEYAPLGVCPMNVKARNCISQGKECSPSGIALCNTLPAVTTDRRGQCCLKAV